MKVTPGLMIEGDMMIRNTATPTNEIKKLHLEAVVVFASCNIPEVDPATLKQFLELVNADGTFGSISHEQILKKMVMLLKYVPEVCPHSLMVLLDLLEIKPVHHLSPNTLETGQPKSKERSKSNETIPFLIETQPVLQGLGR